MTKALVQIAAAFVGSLGFSAVFGVRRKYWLLISVNGMLSWTVYLLCCLKTGNFFSNLAAAVFCSLYAHVAARLVKAPVTVLMMPASVPMIPGGSLYDTMFYALSGDAAKFRDHAFVTAETIFAMAIGFALVALFFQANRRRPPI